MLEGTLRLNPERILNVCPKCHRKAKFVSIGVKNAKGKAPVVWGRYKCSKCDWQSELQELDHHPATRLVSDIPHNDYLCSWSKLSL